MEVFLSWTYFQQNERVHLIEKVTFRRSWKCWSGRKCIPLCAPLKRDVCKISLLRRREMALKALPELLFTNAFQQVGAPGRKCSPHISVLRRGHILKGFSLIRKAQVFLLKPACHRVLIGLKAT
jgi:hypothetical protein